MDFGLPTIIGITVICYLAALGLRNIEKASAWIPTICGVLGGILGFVGMNLIPDFPATDPITSIAIGIASGLAATGVNQAARQLSGYYKK